MDIKVLVRYIKTTNDVAAFESAIEDVIETIYKTNTLFEESLSTHLPYEHVVAIKELATKEKINLEDKAAVQNFLIKLQEALKAVPIIQITLATRPKASLVKQIHQWFYDTFHKLVLLEITINPQIIAGSIINANGKYYDYSLEKETKQLFATQPA